MYNIMDKLNKDTLVTLEVVKQLKEFKITDMPAIMESDYFNELQLILFFRFYKDFESVVIQRKDCSGWVVDLRKELTLELLDKLYKTISGKHLEVSKNWI